MRLHALLIALVAPAAAGAAPSDTAAEGTAASPVAAGAAPSDTAAEATALSPEAADAAPASPTAPDDASAVPSVPDAAPASPTAPDATPGTPATPDAVLAAPTETNATTAARVPPTAKHVPRNAQLAGETLVIRLQVEGDWRLERIELVARTRGTNDWRRYPFARTTATDMEAIIPAALVGPPGLEYYIASVDTDGVERNHFASAGAPHPVNVHGESADTRERARLAEHGGHRSRLAVASTFTAFGSREVTEGVETEAFSDRFWTLQASYAWRPLRRIYQFGFGFVLMRGQWPQVEGEPAVDAADPGVNYGHADLEVITHERLAVGARLHLGANAEGFVAGGGGWLRVGRLAGTHFAGLYERIADVGYRLDLRFHWATVERFPMALGVEYSDWPHPDDATAAVLSYDLGFRVTPELTLALRAGVANRAASLDTGYSAGLGAAYSF